MIINQGEQPDDQNELLRKALMGLGVSSMSPQYDDPSPQSVQPAPSMSQLPAEHMDTDAMPQAQQPNATLAHASMADQPAAKWAGDAQTNLDNFEHRPMWKKMLVPAIIGAASIAGARTRNGARMQENAQQDLQNYQNATTAEHNTLRGQVQKSRDQQQSEYEADQRNRQQDIISQGNNQARSLVAQIAAGGRKDVANTAADARRYSADTGADARRDVADTGASARRDVGEMTVEASTNRFNEGQDRQDARQSRSIAAASGRQGAGFAHTDGKPTATEDNRADLADNLNHNLDKLEEIVHRRPDLFPGGSLIGMGKSLINKARLAAGTNDADLGQLKTLLGNIGMASQGAHSMRNGHLVESIGNDLTNSLKNGPDATLAAIRAARGSVATFGETHHPTTAGPPRIPLASKVAAPSNQIQQFTEGGKLYKIPANKVAEFKRDHPNAR